MALSGSLLLFLGFISIAEIAFSICVPPIHCIENLDDFETQTKYEYVMEQYRQLNIKIEGKPVGLHGKVVTFDLKTEYHLVFHYVDHTLNDVIQTCTFVITKDAGKCDGIACYCTGFLKRAPRPLLNLKPLSVCKNDLHFAEEDLEMTTELNAGEGTEAVPKKEPKAEVSIKAINSTKEPHAETTELNNLSKFRMFN